MEIERKPEILKQADANSCLACSLLYVIGEEVTGQEFLRENERQLFFDSFGKCRESFVLSHVLALSERFPNLNTTLFVDNEPYGDYLRGLVNERVQIESEPVSLELIKNESKKQPLVVLVDRYFFDYEIHIPHYVAAEQEGEDFSVADPWDGEIKIISPLQLQEAIFGAKYILWWAPTVIKIDPVG